MAKEESSLAISPAKHLFDLSGNQQFSLALPSDVALYKDRVYVVDSGNNRIMVFDRKGNFKFVFASAGSGDGQLLGPLGIDVDGSGNVYVADRNNYRIQVYDRSGKYIRQFPVVEKGVKIKPVDVLIYPKSHRLYVTGNSNHKVMAFNTDGKFLMSWGGYSVKEGEFRYPATMALTIDKKIAVTDVLNSRVQVFNNDGSYLVSVGNWGVLQGQLVRPKGVTIDHQGRFYISDSYMGLVQVFDSNSRFLSVLGSNGKPEDISGAVGMSIDFENHLYVARMLENKVSVYSVEP